MVQAILHAHLVPQCPHADILGPKGRAWLLAHHIPLRFVPGRFGWCWTTKASMPRSGRRSVRLPAIRMFRLVIAEARSLIRQRNEIEAMADQLLAESHSYKRLRQIPGIGPIIALAILAEVAISAASAIIVSS